MWLLYETCLNGHRFECNVYATYKKLCQLMCIEYIWFSVMYTGSYTYIWFSVMYSGSYMCTWFSVKYTGSYMYIWFNVMYTGSKSDSV